MLKEMLVLKGRTIRAAREAANATAEVINVDGEEEAGEEEESSDEGAGDRGKGKSAEDGRGR